MVVVVIMVVVADFMFMPSNELLHALLLSDQLALQEAAQQTPLSLNS